MQEARVSTLADYFNFQKKRFIEKGLRGDAPFRLPFPYYDVMKNPVYKDIITKNEEMRMSAVREAREKFKQHDPMNFVTPEVKQLIKEASDLVNKAKQVIDIRPEMYDLIPEIKKELFVFPEYEEFRNSNSIAQLGLVAPADFVRPELHQTLKEISINPAVQRLVEDAKQWPKLNDILERFFSTDPEAKKYVADIQQYIKGSFEQNSLKDALEAQKGATHAKEFLEYVLPPSVYRAYAKAAEIKEQAWEKGKKATSLFYAETRPVIEPLAVAAADGGEQRKIDGGLYTEDVNAHLVKDSLEFLYTQFTPEVKQLLEEKENQQKMDKAVIPVAIGSSVASTLEAHGIHHLGSWFEDAASMQNTTKLSLFLRTNEGFWDINWIGTRDQVTPAKFHEVLQELDIRPGKPKVTTPFERILPPPESKVSAFLIDELATEL